MTEMDDVFKFIRAELEALEKGEHEFTCPLCGGRAEVYVSEYNGHKHSWCNDCGVRIVE